MTRRVFVELTPTDDGWDVTVDATTSRTLRAEPVERFGRLPMPPDATVPDVAQLRGMLARLDDNDPEDTDAAAVGRYLLACLFDDVTWTGLRDGGSDLQLVLATGEPELHRLPWELLHDEHGFLAARSAPAVTIVRLAGRPAENPRPVAIQPVILVVMGGAFDEAGLQPAAEYLALLDTLRQGELALPAHLIVNASADDLKAACEHLKPDVVHVIAHGEQQAGGAGYVELAPARPGDRPSQVEATGLLQILGTGGDLPRVLILTACRTASTGLVRTAGATTEPFTFQHSLAARCVSGGVPIVSAMAGAITSRACREFTLGFYAALLTGGDVVEAAASGRRTAFVAGGPSGRAVDWAYPTVFCGPGYDGRVEVTDAAALAARAARARELLERFRSPLAFCGRQDVLDACRRLLAPAVPAEPGALAPVTAPGPRVLALGVAGNVTATTKLGASRALAQLGASASLAGWAVARLAHTIGDNRAVGFRQLAGQLVGAAIRAAEAVGATAPAECQILLLAERPRAAGLHPELRRLLDLDLVAPDSDGAIGRALVLDLAAVRRAVLAAPSPGRGLLVLIDDLHRYGPGVAPLVVFATSYGLGTAADPVPLAFSYREGDDDGTGAVESIVTFVQQGPVRRVEITPFVLPSGALAYQQLLLGSSPPLVPVAGRRDAVLEEIHISSGGVPYEFDKAEVLATIRMARRLEAVEPATDPQRLAVMLGRQP